MVKVVVDDRRGLVQESGSGNMVLDNIPLQVKSSGGSVTVKSVSTDKNVATSTVQDYTDAIPANSIVVGVKVTCITPCVAGGAVNLTDIGIVTGPDVDAFATGLTADMKTANTAAIIGGGPVDTGAGYKFYAAAESVRLTLSGAPSDTTGVLRLTVYYYDLS
tara:strand:+ start:553 stop:1038 length:486 start_codon:yes stop_codon:yes gene_type:complete